MVVVAPDLLTPGRTAIAWARPSRAMTEGEEVEVHLFERYRPAELYFIGSHDPHLDLVMSE